MNTSSPALHLRPTPPNAPPIRAVLFDLDDSLWPNGPVILRAEQILQSWLEQYAPKVAALGVAHLRAQRERLIAREPYYKIDLWALRMQLLQEVFAEAGEHDADGSRVQEAMQVFARARNEVELFADVPPGLARLSRDWQLGTISNGFADLQQIGIAHHFQVSLAAHNFGRAKPDPAIFHAACEKLGLAAQECLYAGDDLLLDVQGAQQAGMRAVWLKRHEKNLSAEQQQIKPDAICRDLHELTAFLLQQAR